MIVIAIIGILASALYPTISNYFKRAKEAGLFQEIRIMGIAANTDFIDFESYAWDSGPSWCQFATGALAYAQWTWSSTLPRFVQRGLYPLGKWLSVPKGVDPWYCFDWQNWDQALSYTWWASIDVYNIKQSDPTHVIVEKRYCLTMLQNSGTGNICANIGFR
jgi:hypothetical protein